MNYMFQVDLLDNGALDYSEQALNALNESSLHRRRDHDRRVATLLFDNEMVYACPAEWNRHSGDAAIAMAHRCRPLTPIPRCTVSRARLTRLRRRGLQVGC